VKVTNWREAGGFRREMQPPSDSIWFLKRKTRVSYSGTARLLLGFQGTKGRLGEKEYRAPFSDAGGCHFGQNSGHRAFEIEPRPTLRR